MPDAAVQVVWLRRDLRVDDHPLLHDAARRGPVLPVFIVEPGWLADATFGARHWTFVRECLADVDAALTASGQPLRVRIGEAVAVLEALSAESDRTIGAVWAAAEPGRRAAARDAAVAAWAAGRGVAWHVMAADTSPTRTAIARPARLGGIAGAIVAPGALPDAAALGLADDGLTADVLEDDSHWLTDSGRRRVRGGSAAGRRLLTSFLEVRGQAYDATADDPLAAPLVGSRIGAHLAWGALSAPSVHAALRAAEQGLARRRGQGRTRPQEDRQDAGHGPAAAAWRASFAAFGEALAAREGHHDRFAGRPHLEPAADEDALAVPPPGERSDGPSDASTERTDGGADAAARLEAWAAGETGRPLIDAAIAQLTAIGWLPYRLRAVVTSFAIHDLRVPWPWVGRRLARLCLDHDPAILWPIVRRIAGALDGSGPRVYNPDRQARSLDPAGLYVRAWLPALERVPDSFVHNPWLMSSAMQARAGCRVGADVPAPLTTATAAERKGHATAARGRTANPPNGDGGDEGPRQLPLGG